MNEPPKAMDTILDDDIDDITFSKDDRAALCKDNRHRRSKVGQNSSHACWQWNCWKFVAMATVCALMIALIAVLSRTCESNSPNTAENGTGDGGSEKSPSDAVGAKSSPQQKTTGNCSKFPWSDSRLPKWVVPLEYELRIHPNLTLGTFSGDVTVELNVTETTDVLILNAKNLHINNVQLRCGQFKVDVKDHKICAESEQLAVSLFQKLNVGKTCKLSIDFKGNLSEQMDGLYRSFYIKPDGSKKYVAVTQFESTDARAMVPCWDEPSFKAHFSVKIVREPDVFGLSNTGSVKNETLPNGLVEETFEKTVKMSTYLLAVIICDFERISNRTAKGVLVSVYAPAYQISQAKLALDMAVRGLEYYETFFKIDYPLKKLDLISLNDFASGAMENWGMITFRDTYLLFDPLVSTSLSEERIASVILHELAHQWFGNLVTMKWWNDLWLNEGFADFLETYATDKLEPEWNLLASFVSDNVASAMYLDGLIHTHPISVPVTHPSEIESVFDAISYQKGASVLRMLMGMVGPEKMQDSLQVYLNKFKYSNAEGKDLWNVIYDHVPSSAMDGLSVSEFMTNFTEQSGYPVVQIVCSNGKLYANQTRFFYLREEMEKERGSQSWHIYLTVKTDTGKKVNHWMKKERESKDRPFHKVSFDLSPTPKWFKVNEETNGFFRVQYEDKVWQALTKQLVDDHKVLESSDRAGLLNDAFTFLRVGMVDLETAFGFFPYLASEEARGPWSIAASHIFNIESNLRESEAYLPFKNYMRDILSLAYKKVGWTQSQSHEAKLTQQQVLTLACKFDVGDCTVRAILQFKDFLQDKSKKILPDHRSILCGSAVQNDSEVTWDSVFNLYNTTKVPSEKLDYLRCLCTSDEPWRLSRVLEMTLNPSVIRPNLMATVINQVASNINGKYLAWRFIQRRYEEINKLVSSNLMSSVIKSLSYFNTKFDYDQVVTFFDGKKLGGAQRAYDQTLEGIRINIQFLEQNEAKVKKFLQKKGYWKGVV